MWIDLSVTYTKEDLPVDNEDVATLEKIKEWKYPEGIAGEITQGNVFLLAYSSVAIAQRL